MNDITKLLWAATLIVVGFLAASWLGPPAAIPPEHQPQPAGWQSERLTPLAEPIADVEVGEPNSVVQTSGHTPGESTNAANDWANPPRDWQEPPALAGPTGGPQFVPSLKPPGLAEATTPAAAASATAAPQFFGRSDWWNDPPSGRVATTTNRPAMVDAWGPAPKQPNTPRPDSPPAQRQFAPADQMTPPALLPPEATEATPLATTAEDRSVGFAAGSLTRVDNTPSQPQASNRPQAMTLDAWSTPIPNTNEASDRERVHIVADGDSLARLAQRYLGNAERASDLFQANRDKLQDPRLLPIGAELRIPSATTTGTPTSPAFGAPTTGGPQARLQPPRAARPGDGAWP